MAYIANGKFEFFTGALVAQNNELIETVRSLWPEDVVKWNVYEKGGNALEEVMINPPDVLLTGLKLPDMLGTELVACLKGENVYSTIPTVLCLESSEFPYNFEPSFVPDDFVVFPQDLPTLKARIEMALMRAQRNADCNPLTHLPGNTSIINYFQYHIKNKTDFAMGYCDLDYFKSFNDAYGFSRGDEVLLMTARIILNTARRISPDNFFVGHIGGDDFLFALRPELAEEACKNIISSFDTIVPQFYDAKDREKGCLKSIDRRGNECVFPIMAISIGVVFNVNGNLTHYNQASEIAMELKKKAKATEHSHYILDRRRPSDAT